MPPIEEYRFNTSTPDEELMVMCRMLSEVGSYASTRLDRTHQLLSRKCRAAQRSVEIALLKRKSVTSVTEIYDVPQLSGNTSPLSYIQATSALLSSLSVDRLEILYRQAPLRAKARAEEKREPLTRYFETAIVEELKTRKAATRIEQLKIDYCIRTNRNELNNLSTLLRMPVGHRHIDIDNCKSPQEMQLLIDRLRNYSTVAERDMLLQTVDKALCHIENNRDTAESANLAATLVELHHQRKAMCPEWVETYLLESIKQWKKNPPADETDMVIPLLTAATYHNDSKARWKAVRILTRTYRDTSRLLNSANLETSILLPTPNYTALKVPSNVSNCELCIVQSALSEKEHSELSEKEHSALLRRLRLLTACREYITNYNPRTIASAWTRLCGLTHLRRPASSTSSSRPMRPIY